MGTSRKHRKKWWTQMTKKERQQLREAKGETKRMDKVADRYAAIALGIKPKAEIGYSQRGIKRKLAENDDNASADKSDKKFKERPIVTKDWERVWCEFCKHPNPKSIMFCQLCDSNLQLFRQT